MDEMDIYIYTHTHTHIHTHMLTAIGLTTGGSSTVHIYTQNTTKFGRVRAVPRLCELYPGICLITEEKAQKTLSQGSDKPQSR
jgi:hypothetical protein